MDLFKQNNINESTALDFYAKCCSYSDNKKKRKDKKMLHKIARSRLKVQTVKEACKHYEDK